MTQSWDENDEAPFPSSSDYGMRPQDFADRETKLNGGAGTKGIPIEPLDWHTPAEWQGKAVPDVDWFVPGLFVRGGVGLLSSDGGKGKSLLMMQLATACAIGDRWLDFEVPRCRSLAWFCEDPQNILHMRQAGINKHYACDMIDADDFTFTARVGKESSLCEFERFSDKPKPTILWDQLVTKTLDWGAQLVLLDTCADVFGGNEVSRIQVRRFIMMLSWLANKIDGLVLLSSHVSVEGMKTGSGISGSTAWNNSVRSRAYLTGDKQRTEADGQLYEGDRDVRYLKTMKQNYGAAGESWRLRWQDGVFVRDLNAPEDEPVHTYSPSSPIDRLTADQRIIASMTKLIGRGARISPMRKAHANLASVLHGEGECVDLDGKYIFGAQERLTASGKLVQVTIKVDSKSRPLIRPADARYPEEVAAPQLL